MLVSPGVVMARAPCAAQYCTASWGVLPARKAQASLKSRLSQNPQEDRAGKHGEAATGFADVEPADAYAAWFGALRDAFCCANLRRPSTTSLTSWRAARRFASISTADTAMVFFGDPAGLVFGIEEFMEARPGFSVVDRKSTRLNSSHLVIS